MQRLRTTFKRSRTPTGAEMKTQSSLEVPKQVRSASFDEIQLEAKRCQAGLSPNHPRREDPGGGSRVGGFLAVPSTSQQQRSKSFDSTGSGVSLGGEGSSSGGGVFLEVPGAKRFQRRRSSGDKPPPYCVHCNLLDGYSSQFRLEEQHLIGRGRSRDMSYSDASTSDDEEDVEWESEEEAEISPVELSSHRLTPSLDQCSISIDVCSDDVDPNSATRVVSPHCLITVTLSPTSLSSPPPVVNPDPQQPQTDESSYSPSGRRRSITSARLERQQAFIFNETVSAAHSNSTHSDNRPPPPPPSPNLAQSSSQESDVIVNQFFLAVPELKRDRAASVDSCFLNKSSAGKAEEVVPAPSGALLALPPAGSANLRSRSVDIVLPTDQQAHYKALAMNSVAAAPTSGDDGSGGSPTRSASVGVVTRVTPDWGGNASDSDHLWVPINPSNDFCYCGESECTVSKTSKSGIRYKCSSCKIICHTNCLSVLERLKFPCKPTFRDVGVRSYREQTSTKHHWVHRRQQKGKCKTCGKSFHSKLSFSTKEIVALNCSWCKDSYHNKESCFTSERIEEDCSLGTHQPIIVPPAWIVKLPRKGSFKSSLRKSPKKRNSSKKKVSKERSESDASDPSVEKEERTFTLKPIPTSNIKPVIVFINPKSGGNQGIKLLQKFQWLLNPRQVFDLTQGGPRFGLELFRKVSSLRVLACGGDGTVGWVLSVIDQLNFNPPPAVGVLPLGTGNDLARALGWGGGYTDEPISKILYNIGESDVVLLDRWQLNVEKNPNGETSETAKDNLPLNVVNNYFSMGVDAHIALEFHEAREAHPEKFNSRLKNKMFYGQMGGKDLVRRKWKGLADFVTLVCDGKDVTAKLKENKFHAIVFLNIPSYGGGTHPWPKSGVETSTEDGLIEVVGLSTYQLPLLQAGGHGTSICQCRTASIKTTKPIPMQVDGEACKLNPSVITISLLNKAPMLAKKKGGGRSFNTETVLEPLKISINLIDMKEYEQYHSDKARLKNSAVNLGVIEIMPIAELENTRQIIVQKLDATSTVHEDGPRLPRDWCFVDTCTAERFFRIDRAQEHLHYVTDIASDALYILDQTVATPDEDSAFTSMASPHHSPSSQVGETTPELSPSDEAPVEIVVSDGQANNPSISRITQNNGTRNAEELSSADAGYIRLLYCADCSNLLEKTTDGIVTAAKAGDINKLKELHGHGYSLLSIDSTGQTALHYSAQNGYKDVVKYLIASAPHSILNMADNEKGQTALHKAARNQHRSICCMLVAGGASLSLVDNFGNTPRLLALEAKDQQLAAYLESQEQFQLLAEDHEAI